MSLDRRSLVHPSHPTPSYHISILPDFRHPYIGDVRRKIQRIHTDHWRLFLGRPVCTLTLTQAKTRYRNTVTQRPDIQSPLAYHYGFFDHQQRLSSHGHHRIADDENVDGLMMIITLPRSTDESTLRFLSDTLLSEKR